MIFSNLTTLLATIMALGGAANGFPFVLSAIEKGNPPPCKTTPGEYWQCLSDCLYKKCKLGDKACVTSCDYDCGVQWVPGFPGCTPEPW